MSTSLARYTAGVDANRCASALPAQAVDRTAYCAAQLRIVWGVAPGKPRYLILAVLRLIAKGTPVPVTQPELEARLPGAGTHRLYSRWVTCSVDEGLTWYERAVREGVWTRPANESGSIATSDGKEAPLADGDQEPPWPSLTLASERWPRWTEASRSQPLVHMRLPRVAQPLPYIEQQFGIADEFVRDSLQLDGSPLDLIFWGSVHLVADNPVLRRFAYSVSVPAPGTDRVTLRTVLRTPPDQTSLALSLLDRREGAWRNVFEGSLQTPHMEIEIPYPLEAPQLVVRSTNGALLHVTVADHLVRSIAGLTGVVGAIRRVEVPATSSRREESYSVPVVTSTIESSIGTTVQPGAIASVSAAHQRQAERDAVRDLEEVWFDEDVEGATRAVRRLIGRAWTRVLIVDPYVDGVDLLRFLAAIGPTRTIVRVLGSSQGAGSQWSEHGGRLAHLESLRKAANRLHIEIRSTEMSVRLMPGKKPDVHDRFVVVDDEVYLLGSSLGEFGSRGTMMLRLKFPRLVLPRLEEAWTKAVTLDDKIAALLAEAPPAPQSGARAGCWPRLWNCLAMKVRSTKGGGLR